MWLQLTKVLVLCCVIVSTLKINKKTSWFIFDDSCQDYLKNNDRIESNKGKFPLHNINKLLSILFINYLYKK